MKTGNGHLLWGPWTEDQETDGTQRKEGPRKDELPGHENCLEM